MASKKSAAKTAWKVFIGVFVSLLLIMLASELGLRWFLSSQMTKQFESQSSEAPEVSFGKSPLILGMIAGEIPEMNMSTPSTLKIEDDKITGQPASKIHLEGVSTTEPAVARELVTTASLPEEFLLATIQQGIAQKSGHEALGDFVITEIRTNPAEKAVDVEFGGGLFNLTLEPKAVDGQLTFEATSSKLLAWELPEEVTDEISKALSSGMESQLSGQSNLEFQKVAVKDGEIELTMHGKNVNLSELGSQYGDLAPAAEDKAANA